ncbi:PAS domain-containing protein [Halorubrum tebenquichense]|uniref:PAS domain-containing protein n=1 Tax=Halorubrum tebenquichense TaxID=119434 RepID=UPI00067812FA|nr:PAS domain-containing protein [Halorubrum tebenquichense]
MGSNSDDIFGGAQSTAPPEPNDGVRVLLLVHRRRDRELLVDALSDRYAVDTATEAAAIDEAFDCCVLDEAGFERVRERIEPRRERADPAFLPFALLASGDTRSAAKERAWDRVDDVIELPTSRRGLVSRVENLVERRSTSVRLSETVDELRLKERAMDESPVGISLAEATDGDDNPLVYLNGGFEETTGHGEEKLGEDCRFLQGEDTSAEPRAAIREAIAEERPVSVDILNYRANGQKFWNQVTISPIRDDGEEVAHYVGFQTDITDRKIRERRLEVMTRVLKHNLRNKMNLIEGYADLLRGEIDDESQRESLEVISETADDLIGIAAAVRKINETLDGTESDAPIDLAERLVDLRDRTQRRYPDATVTLSLPDGDPIHVTVVGLMVAVEEAVENAVKHNDAANPSVHVRVERRSDGWIAVEVADDGPGIPDHEMRVLEVGETSLTHADRLGIWLMYWVVGRAGGEFDVDTGDDGTTVRLEVPAHP